MNGLTTLKNIQITGSKNKPILVDVLYKTNELKKPIVIFVHGFKGFKDWGHFNVLAQHFAENGFTFVKFNFSHNGTTPEKPDEFTDLEAFGNNNYLIELDDLKLVIDWLELNQSLKTEINIHQIYLIGHSRGGGIALLKAAEDKRIKKIVTWASVSDFINRNKKNTIKHWQEDGVVHTFNTRTKQNMPLYYQFYETIINNKKRLHIKNATKQLEIPYLIIHGTADEAVSITDANELKNACKHAKLIKVEQSGHTFEVTHPFNETTLPENAKFVIEKTLSFFNEN